MDKELKNKIDFINQKTGKKTGFSIPNSYFENIENSLNSVIISNGFTKETAFKTPPNYFHNLENDVLKKLSIKETKVNSLKQKVLQFIPFVAAASVLLFIGLNYFNTANSSFPDNINETDITLWYENGYGNTNNIELASILETSDFKEDNIITFLNDDNLEDYLNTTIDDSLLLTEIE